MKDSTSAASAGAELVLRGFPWAVLVRRPLLPPPETLPDRWLQAAEEAEVESRPFRSLPREEDVPEILDRKHFDQEGVCIYHSKFQGPSQVSSRMSDMSATCQVFLRSLGQAACLFYCKSCHEILRCEIG
ncbi:uncharacterized protein O8D03_016155 [Erethizon dorsatum]